MPGRHGGLPAPPRPPHGRQTDAASSRYRERTGTGVDVARAAREWWAMWTLQEQDLWAAAGDGMLVALLMLAFGLSIAPSAVWQEPVLIGAPTVRIAIATYARRPQRRAQRWREAYRTAPAGPTDGQVGASV